MMMIVSEALHRYMPRNQLKLPKACAFFITKGPLASSRRHQTDSACSTQIATAGQPYKKKKSTLEPPIIIWGKSDMIIQKFKPMCSHGNIGFYVRFPSVHKLDIRNIRDRLHMTCGNLGFFVELPFVHVVLLDIGHIMFFFCCCCSDREQIGDSCETQSKHKRTCKYMPHSKKGGKTRIMSEVGPRLQYGRQERNTACGSARGIERDAAGKVARRLIPLDHLFPSRIPLRTNLHSNRTSVACIQVCEELHVTHRCTNFGLRCSCRPSAHWNLCTSARKATQSCESVSRP